MRILQVLPSLVSGGVERGTLEIASALVAEDHQALVASSGGPLVAELEDMGANHVRLPLNTKNPWIMGKNALALASLVRQQGVDLIHARSRAPAWSALAAARRCGVPFITTYHGIYGQGNAAKRFYNSVMARGDVVIAPSEFTRDYLMQHHPKTHPDRVVVIPRGVDTDYFDPTLWAGQALEIPAIAALIQRAIRPLWILPARLSRWKGHDVALSAFAASGVSGSLIFCGADTPDAPYRQELSQRIRDLGLGERVFFGNVPAATMPALYAAADYVLSPALKPESFGRVIIEAAAMAKIVIATNHGGAAETVIAGETGFLIPPEEAESALTQAMKTVWTLPDAAQHTLGQAARQRMVDHYSLSAMQQATLGVYGGQGGR
jgi:glycosyltransferase involved in cell wall biosynthesis